jgi:hypothetical protein
MALARLVRSERFGVGKTIMFSPSCLHGPSKLYPFTRMSIPWKGADK